MRHIEAGEWLKRLQINYPTKKVRQVYASKRGFRVVFCDGDVTLQEFLRKSKKS